ncbi:MAG TPA: hypothetical protein VFA66_04065 [Gaiellaceae bacterium]|nr:hypothetical protein [Gaiellaceae bacterium]
MAARSAEQLKHELESERQRLGTAVGALRSQAATVRRKLPIVAVGAAGAGVVVRTVAKRIARRARRTS